MDITKKEIGRIRELAQTLLQEELGDDYLVTVSAAKYGYVGSVTLEIAKADGDGNAETRIAKDFKYNARFYGLEEDDLGAVYKTYNGKTMKIVGLKTRNRKYPIIVEDESGSRYKVKVEDIITMKKLGKLEGVR